MASVNVFDVLQKVYGARGLPFPLPPKKGDGSAIAGKFGDPLQGNGTAQAGSFEYKGNSPDVRSRGGSLIRRYDDESLGLYTFLPVKIDGYYLPNPLIIITGSKQIIETDVIDIGTVYEKVFIKPYDISIISTLIQDDGNWPEQYLRDIAAMWEDKDVVTLNCALSDIFLAKTDNFVINKISILDNQGAENVEIIQIDGRSNIQFELEITTP